LDFRSQLPESPNSDAWLPLVRKIAMLKRNCFAAVFEKFFDFHIQSQLKDNERQRAVINYRDNETMYLDSSSDRVVVVFSTVFKDFDDNVIGRVFMEVGRSCSSDTFGERCSSDRLCSFEIFPERRRQNQQAPQVIVSYRKLPDELKDMPNVQTGENMCYFTFGE
jgi:actin related protein 2/3 complex, subunit 2